MNDSGVLALGAAQAGCDRAMAGGTAGQIAGNAASGGISGAIAGAGLGSLVPNSPGEAGILGAGAGEQQVLCWDL